jgi:hypothetical protein
VNFSTHSSAQQLRLGLAEWLAMIEIDSVAEEGWVTSRCRGALSNDDFAALARSIGDFNPDRAQLVFFDWLDI